MQTTSCLKAYLILALASTGVFATEAPPVPLTDAQRVEISLAIAQQLAAQNAMLRAQIQAMEAARKLESLFAKYRRDGWQLNDDLQYVPAPTKPEKDGNPR